MLYSVKGTLTHMEPGIAVIECGGVGFKCLTTLVTQRNLPPLGSQAMLYTDHPVSHNSVSRVNPQNNHIPTVLPPNIYTCGEQNAPAPSGRPAG